MYGECPFEVYGIESRVVRGDTKRFKRNNLSTGEVEDIEEIQPEVLVSHDPASYAKVFHPGFAIMADLNKSGMALFGFILRELRPRSRVVTINRAKAGEFSPRLNGNLLYRGVKDLISHGVIARTLRSNVYWINPNVIFNGNRTRLPNGLPKK